MEDCRDVVFGPGEQREVHAAVGELQMAVHAAPRQEGLEKRAQYLG